MNIALIVIGILAAIIVAIVVVHEIIGRILLKREEARWKRMSPEEKRKYQERMYKAHHFLDGTPTPT